MKNETLWNLVGPRMGVRAALTTIRNRGGSASESYLRACLKSPADKLAARIKRRRGISLSTEQVRNLDKKCTAYRAAYNWIPAQKLWFLTLDAYAKSGRNYVKNGNYVQGGYRWDSWFGHCVVLRSGTHSDSYGQFRQKWARPVRHFNV